MIEKNTFLIATPILNGSEFIEDCIASVRGAFKNYKYIHIIVDGGSTDNTKEIINNMNNDSILFYEMPGSTMYQALNKALDLGEADYFYQLNADDFVLPETADIVLEQFQNDNDLDVVTGLCISVNVETNYCKILAPTKDHFRLDKIGVNLYVSQPSSFVRYDTIKGIGGYSEKYKGSSDTELWLRLIKNASKFQGVNKCLSIDRVHSGCRRMTPEDIKEVKDIRMNYFVSTIHPLLKLRNYFLYLIVLLTTAIRINKVLQSGIESYGSQIKKVWGVFASTKKAGLRINYFSQN